MPDISGFNLLDRPWIDVTTSTGVPARLSILDVFHQAPDLVGVTTELATQRFALSRLLLAILHRAFDGPADIDEWRDLWDKPRFPMERITSYADRVRSRFNLFDDVAPFFQAADLHTARNEVFGLERLVADVPNGEPLFTTRSRDSLRCMPCAEAAQWLVHVHAFDASGIKSGAVGDVSVKGGRGYPIGTGWAGQIGGLLAEGSTFKETLLLNLLARDNPRDILLGGPHDLPPWERPPLTAVRLDREPQGAIDVFTWQTRRIRLFGDLSGVTGVLLANGDKISPQNKHTVEPHTAWRYSEPQSKKLGGVVFMPQTHDPSRQVWRGLSRLLPVHVQSSTRKADDPVPPTAGVVDWLAMVQRRRAMSMESTIRYTIAGAAYGSQNAVIDEVVDDSMACPALLLGEDRRDLAEVAVRCVESTDTAVYVLARLADNLTVAAGGDRNVSSEAAREAGYAAVDQPIRRWLKGLDPGTDSEAARGEWHRTADRLIRALGAGLLASAGPAAWVGRGEGPDAMNAARAQELFHRGLHKALPLAHPSPPQEGAA